MRIPESAATRRAHDNYRVVFRAAWDRFNADDPRLVEFPEATTRAALTRVRRLAELELNQLFGVRPA